MTTRASRTRGMPRRSAPVAAPSRMPLLLGGGLLVLVVLAALVAFALSGTASSGLAEPARAATGVSGTALPAFSDPASDRPVGQPIPTLTGTDLAGEAISIGPGDGPMVVVALAHWCSVCQAEVPVLVDYLESTGMPERRCSMVPKMPVANRPPACPTTACSWASPSPTSAGSAAAVRSQARPSSDRQTAPS